MRRGWRAALFVGLVVAVTGGVGLAAVAGERRTASSYGRFLASVDASDLSIDTVSYDDSQSTAESVESAEAILEDAARLPSVVSSTTYWGIGTAFTRATLDDPTAPSPEVVGSADGRFFTADRPALLAGRMPSLDATDEAFINEAYADTGIAVGDTVELAVFDPDRFYADTEAAFEDGPDEIVEVTVVGIGVLPDEVLTDEFDRSPRIVVPPPLTERMAAAREYAWQGLILDGSVPVDEVIADYQQLTPDRVVLADRTADEVDGVRRAQRPTLLVLGALGALALASALALGSILAARSVLLAGSDASVLRAVGAARHTRAIMASLPAVAGAGLGAIAACGLALALSPLAPVGPVRRVEPARGVDADWTVLAAGGIGLALAVSVTAAVMAMAADRRLGKAPRRRRQPLLGGAVGRAPLAVGLGTRWAVERGRGRAGVSGPLATATATVAVAVAGAALLFGTTLDRTAAEPERFGWTFDQALIATSGYGDASHEAVSPILDADDRVDAWATIGVVPTLELGGSPVPALGLGPGRGHIEPLVLSGRAPAAGEVALGVRTARALGVGVGDAVATVGPSLEVVGLVALPAIGAYSAENPGLGEGAWLRLETLQELSDAVFTSIVLADLAEGATQADADELATELSQASAEDSFVAVGLLRPAELVDVGAAVGTARLLAAFLLLVAVAVLAVGVATTVARRRHEVAVLRAVGVERRTIRWAVLVQAFVGAVTAAALGAIAGALVGVVGWRGFAEDIGVAREIEPFAGRAVLVAVGVTAVAVALAVPTVGSARRDPGPDLRTAVAG